MQRSGIWGVFGKASGFGGSGIGGTSYKKQSATLSQGEDEGSRLEGPPYLFTGGTSPTEDGISIVSEVL